MSAPCLVVGVGNELLRDEGVGVHVARRLDPPPDGTEVVVAGLALFELAPKMAGRAHVILVDAVRAGGVPGTVYRLELDGARGLPVEPALSLHQWGVADAIRAISLVGMLPARLTVLGVEPGVIEVGMELSPEVEDGVEKLVELLRQEAR